ADADRAQAALRIRRSIDFGKPCSATRATVRGLAPPASDLSTFLRAAPPMHYLMRRRHTPERSLRSHACSTPPVVRLVSLRASEHRPAAFDLTGKAHRRAS